MSQFYASIQGNRGEATRGGTKGSGITGHIRGWQGGVRVDGGMLPGGGERFRITITGGSGGHSADRELATVDETGRILTLFGQPFNEEVYRKLTAD